MNITTIVRRAKENSEVLAKFDRNWNSSESVVGTLIEFFHGTNRFILCGLVFLALITFTVEITMREWLSAISALGGIVIVFFLLPKRSLNGEGIRMAFEFIEALSILEEAIGIKIGELKKIPNSDLLENPWGYDEPLIKEVETYLKGVAGDVDYWQRCHWNKKKAEKQRVKFEHELRLLKQLLPGLATAYGFYFPKKET